MVGFEASAPVPVFPGERPEPDRVVVGKGDMELVALPSRKGRPRKVQNQQQLAEVLRLYFIEKLSMRRIADVIGVSHMSVYRMLSDPNLELLI